MTAVRYCFLCVCVRDIFSESFLNGHNDILVGVRWLTFFHCMLNAALSQVTNDSHVIKRCEILITIYHGHKMQTVP